MPTLRQTVWIVVLFLGSLLSTPVHCQETAPEAATETLRRGIDRFQAGDFEAAIELFSSILETSPDHEVALYERALSYYSTQSYDACLADAKAGIALKGEHEAQLYAIGGSCLSSDGKGKKAVKFFRKGLDRYPEDTSILLNIAVSLSQQGESATARTHLKALLRVEPEHPSGNFYLAALFEEEGYRIPATYQYLRFLSIESSSQRSAAAATAFLRLLNIGFEKTGNDEFSLLIPQSQPMDEGDFSGINLLVSFLAASATTEDYQELAEAPRIAKVIDSLIALTEERKSTELQDTFVWQHAISRLVAMRQAEVLEPFSYLAFSTLDLDGGDAWFAAHTDAIKSYQKWNAKHLF